MSIFQNLPKNEQAMISNWIEDYGYLASPSHHREKASLEKVLAEWAKQKENLFNMFGNNLILTKSYMYTKPIDEIIAEFDTLRSDGVSAINTFLYNLRHTYIAGDNSPLMFSGQEYRFVINGLVSSETLAKNVYQGGNCEIPTPDGKTIKVEDGCKPVKMLGKIAKAYGIAGFEEFRIAHSQSLNQKKLMGEMCLSIHPLDFMTMSDNNNDWESCMSWCENGCYRSGTIECMNSPIVIVAYLKDREDMPVRGGVWSNKKWRSLFIVHPQAITAVKGYPYQNDDFNTFILNWLRELSPETYGDIIQYEYHSPGVRPLHEEHPRWSISFEASGHMYNDFGSIKHWGMFKEETLPAWAPYWQDRETLTIDYSGYLSCIHCGYVGSYYDWPDDETELVCSDCCGTIICCDCEERINTDEAHELDGDFYCEYCYAENVRRCQLTGENHHCSRLVDITLVPANFNPNVDSSIFHEFPTIEISEDYIYGGNEMTEDYPEYFKNKNDILHKISIYWTSYHYLYLSDLTPYGLKKLYEFNSIQEAEDELKNIME